MGDINQSRFNAVWMSILLYSFKREWEMKLWEMSTDNCFE